MSSEGKVQQSQSPRRRATSKDSCRTSAGTSHRLAIPTLLSLPVAELLVAPCGAAVLTAGLKPYHTQSLGAPDAPVTMQMICC